MDSATDEAFAALLRFMRDSRDFDFTGYKRTSLIRRVRHRLDQAGYTSFPDLLSWLFHHAQVATVARGQLRTHPGRADDNLLAPGRARLAPN